MAVCKTKIEDKKNGHRMKQTAQHGEKQKVSGKKGQIYHFNVTHYFWPKLFSSQQSRYKLL